MTPSIGLLLVIAPLMYWTLGAPFLLHRGASAVRMALLTGGAVAGLCCEVSFAAGIRSSAVLVPILIACALVLVVRRKKWQWRSLGEAYVLYVVALVPAVVSPFPIIGVWGGDWLYLLNAGNALWEGGRLSIELLQRPPLFGAATAPLWLISDGLIPYQILSTVMSAGALGACLYAADRFCPSISPYRLLAPLVLSVFFLHNTAACWGKLTAAAFLLASAVDLSREHSRARTWWAGIWFALAVAMHQSSVIYVPLFIAIAASRHDLDFRTALKTVGIFATCLFILVGLYEGWTVWEYGLGAKIAANPSVAQRNPEVSFITNTFFVILTSFVGWAPLDHLIGWLHAPDFLSGVRASKEIFWLATSWVEVLAGTFLGAYLPFLLIGGRELVVQACRSVLEAKGQLLFGAIVLVIVLNGVLNPFFSRNGTMQTGLVGLGLAGFLMLGAWLESEHPRRWSLALGITVVTGTIPWLLLNLGVSTGVRFSESFRTAFVTGSEGDWQCLVENHLTPLGLIYFPVLQLAVFGVLAIACMQTWLRPKTIATDPNASFPF